MNKKTLRLLGFNEEVDSIEHCKCPFCKKLVVIDDFTNVLSLKEFGISGLCQSCQNEVFGSDNETPYYEKL